MTIDDKTWAALVADVARLKVLAETWKAYMESEDVQAGLKFAHSHSWGRWQEHYPTMVVAGDDGFGRA